MKRNSALLYTLVLAAVPALSSAQTWLTAAPTANNYYGGSLFNFRNDTSGTLRLTGLLDLNLSGNGGASGRYQLYTKNSALVGSEGSATGWSLLGDTVVNSTNAQGTFTTVDFGKALDVAAGQTVGLAVFYVTPGNASNPNAGGFIGYNSGANTYTDGSVTISTGITKGYDGSYVGDPNALFGIAQSFNPRSFSGRVQYAPVAPVPEPFSIAAIGLGLAGLAMRRRKRA